MITSHENHDGPNAGPCLPFQGPLFATPALMDPSMTSHNMRRQVSRILRPLRSERPVRIHVKKERLHFGQLTLEEPCISRGIGTRRLGPSFLVCSLEDGWRQG